MKARRHSLSKLFLIAIMFLCLLPPVAGQALPHATQAASEGDIIFSEVMPLDSGEQHDWVELYRGGTAERKLYIPLILKDYSGPTAVSLLQPVAAMTPEYPDISGWQLANEQGLIYIIPDALPPVPPDCYIVIYFDGLGPGADDYDFSDRKAVLHSPQGAVNTLGDAAGVLGLYTAGQRSSQSIRDFVAWGQSPGEAAADAIAAGLWRESWFVDLYVGSGARAADAVLTTRSLGLYPGHSNRSPEDWAIYLEEDMSPGAVNPIPRAYWATVPDGIVMANDGFALGWPLVPGATYRLQIDDDPNFGSPLVDTVLNTPSFVPTAPLPAGSYYWRVNSTDGHGHTSAWSTPLRVNVIAVTPALASVDADRGLDVELSVELTMTWLRQRKDTKLLCLDGDNEGNPASSADEEAWDARHPDAIYTHGRNNCVRASICMMVTHYGGNLSQDRLSYYMLENHGSPIENQGQVGNPHVDLGHDRTTLVCGGDGSTARKLTAWALGVAESDITYGWPKPSFTQIQNWIDANRPIMRFDGVSHQTVIGGYRVLSGNIEQVRVFDPWSGTSWQNYSNVPIYCYYVPPASCPNVRSDEPGISTDSDGDGIMDWDEQVRFQTSPILADSDEDWVQDKADLREYVFNAFGTYNLRNADMDGDGKRKERDPDNDNDGSVDGCEDTNFNGKYEPSLGETDNFSVASQKPCAPRFDILSPRQSNPVNAGVYNSPDKILVQVRTAIPPAATPPTYTPSDFAVKIGIANATVQAVYRVADTHFLVVSAPAQASADYYDLQVTLQSTQTDTETRAVFYLPRLRADQVLVLDRSGSMSDYGKLDAAKNAARAFIDHASVGDMIGVVSFETSAAVNYALTTISGATEYNAAKDAVNALTLGGATALGQGALLGYNQLNTRGASDHDWAVVLMSDGMENVVPYWSSTTVSGVIVPSRVVVNTVALGYDADRILLAAIAAQTDGRAYQAGVDLLPSLAETEASAAPENTLPSTLPNRLADVYKSAAEVIAHQQRLFEKTGRFAGELTFEVYIETGLPEVIFAVNWDSPNTPVQLGLRDPRGNAIGPGMPGVEFLNDMTHQQYRVQRPAGGFWVATLSTRDVWADYMFMVSAHSETSLHLGFGIPIEERTVGTPIPIVVVLSDYRTILGSEVWAWVQGPNVELREALQLFDDGAHNDGRPNDGVYANTFTRTNLPGPYMVKAVGRGRNNYGEAFVRYRTGGFNVLSCIAYVWQHDLATANQYRALLAANGLCAKLVHMDSLPGTPLNQFGLLIVGPDTGYLDSWGTPAALATIRQYGIPVLGLGEGGYALFGQFGLAIGHPHGWHGEEPHTFAMEPDHQVWNSPFDIPMTRDRVVTVYNRTEHVGLYIPRPPADVLLIGREPTDQTHYNLAKQNRFTLWGFHNGPSMMTGDGKNLFINMVRFLAGF